ncbi:MAG: type II toxin-antitoxin system RelE/ParE family toxin [Vicinamibacterales bacterium]
MIPTGNRLEALKGDQSGRYSVRVNDQYRVTFLWEGGHASGFRTCGCGCRPIGICTRRCNARRGRRRRIAVPVLYLILRLLSGFGGLRASDQA